MVLARSPVSRSERKPVRHEASLQQILAQPPGSGPRLLPKRVGNRFSRRRKAIETPPGQITGPVHGSGRDTEKPGIEH